MKNLISLLKEIATLVFWFAIFYSILFYVAHFTDIQSFILTFVGLAAFFGYKSAFTVASMQKPNFEPFWVSIRPNWYSICEDFGLASVEKWTEIERKCEATPAEYSVVRNGLNFTMLSQTLFFSNDHQSFFGELDFMIAIEELRPDKDQFSTFAPCLYLKQTVVGEREKSLVLEFGLVTQKSLHESIGIRDDRSHIPIARLPEIVFFGYMHPDTYGNWSKMKKIDEQTKKELARFGWTQDERDPEDSWLNRPLEITHKHFRVIYRGLS